MLILQKEYGRITEEQLRISNGEQQIICDMDVYELFKLFILMGNSSDSRILYEEVRITTKK